MILYIQNIIKTIYTGPIRKASHQLGIHPYLSYIYQKARDARITLDYWRSPNIYSITVDGLSADIQIDTRHEYGRVAIDFPHEKDLVRTILRELQPDEVVWDIGANIGTHTCLLANRVKRGDVVAFEPLPSNVSRLRENVRVNGLQNVTIKPVALSDETGQNTLSLSSPEAGIGDSTLAVEKRDRATTAQVQTERGDDLVGSEIPAPNVIKIDVEGAELAVLDGLEEILSAPTTYLVLCEVHENYPDVTISAVEEHLETYGFSIETNRITGTTPFVWARRERG